MAALKGSGICGSIGHALSAFELRQAIRTASRSVNGIYRNDLSTTTYYSTSTFLSYQRHNNTTPAPQTKNSASKLQTTHPLLTPPPQQNNHYSTMSKPTHLSSDDLYTLLANRRSYYNLTTTSPLTTTQIQTILSNTLLKVPSAFNTQSTRLILLVGPHHQKLWDITASILRKHMGEERWSSAPTAGKLAGFRAAYGTVMFFEDDKDTADKKEQFAGYAQHFDAWAEQTNGMHQLAVWTALEAEGLGANLQHYNPVIDGDVHKEWNVPEEWRLRAQLVFGGIEGGRPDEKEKKDVESRLMVFGAEE